MPAAKSRAAEDGPVSEKAAAKQVRIRSQKNRDINEINPSIWQDCANDAGHGVQAVIVSARPAVAMMQVS
ncbi:MAG: hypothetical protein JOY83_11410 [Alphaproteobacteria bacterium]|nr:hypothetical protein [Alphaproteobacteria bacterium]